MRNSVEQRREKLINKLFGVNVFKIEGKQLYELPLSILEREYRKYQAEYHPHGEFGSIRWS
ncbi:Fur-regulated basic protein FbpA [Bacillus tuaregi]|uniref:Fur-regulated basic protein FbpA n=1 Tax=Bacillus tuaregi TaxID=1816695 RepID=UPI0008F820F9|nr:Fur-regulated basic protein FbpA [Bacillus tuaregi]